MIAERYVQDVLVSTAGRMGDPEAASDVTQQTFLDACVKLLKGEGPQNPDHLGGWLYRFSRNRELNHYKRRDVIRKRSVSPHAHGDGFGSDVSRVGLARDDEGRLAQVAGIVGRVARTLAADEQEIYRLFFEQELTAAEVTEQLALSGRALSEKTVANKVTRITAAVAVGFDAYLLVQHDRTLCRQLTGIVGRYPQEFGSELRDHVLKHARKCADCGSCAVCPTCRVRDILAISTCEKSSGCQRCRVCDNERLALKAEWAPALVVLLFLRPVRTAVLEAVNQAWSAAVSVLSSAPAKPPGSPPGPPPAGGPLHRPVIKAATAAVVAAAVTAGALLLTRPDADPSPQTVPVAASMPTIAYATDKEVRVQTKEKAGTVGTVATGSTVTDLVWSADRQRVGWLAKPSRGTATTLHTTDLSTGQSRTWACQDCAGLAFQDANLVSVRQHAQMLSHPPSGKPPKTLELRGIDTPATGLQLFLVGSTAAGSGLLIFTMDNGLNGAEANKLYRTAANGMATTVVDDTLQDIPGGARRPGQYAAVNGDGTRFAYGGNDSGGNPCGPPDRVTVIDLDTDKHTTTALPHNDAPPHLRITGLWFGPGGEVWASAFREPAESCVAYGKGAAIRRQQTAAYRLRDGTWAPSGQDAVMAQTTGQGWSARRAAATGLNDYRPPASPLVVTNAKKQQVALHDSVTVFAWAPGPSTAVPVLGTLWAPYQKGYGLPRPRTFFNGGSTSGSVRDVTWTSWGGPRATGTGEARYLTEGASVADSPWEKSTVVAFDLGDCDGVRAYRQVAWFHPQHGGRFDRPSSSLNACKGDEPDTP